MTPGGKKQQDPSTDPSSAAARIRNNQRRSRARHREFVDELKAKVREYERQGVQATMEMRHAARKVALENSRLRALLASRGVTDEELSSYLAQFDDQPSGPLPTAALTPPTDEASPLPARSDSHSGSSRANRDVPDDESASGLKRLAVAADTTPRQTCCGPTTRCSAIDGRDVQEPAAQPSPPADQANQPSPSPSPNTPNTTGSHLEMSCTAAAQIMANMSRDGNKELAREALGCTGAEECLVKNTLVFQLLDSAEAGQQ
ncbi:uncharacterized protein B0H64DRAFT_80957 [Chaetomium fimeti]|uniref:BZIP domain-containing protein n=1 Tax=Chaetomium fimeti TaxID=1854472 RepID=A0AAE0LV62_9PEZI|nr:hypothetical protein B0H64DRAFT_80957 [Chaetomium fimeti]